MDLASEVTVNGCKVEETNRIWIVEEPASPQPGPPGRAYPGWVGKPYAKVYSTTNTHIAASAYNSGSALTVCLRTRCVRCGAQVKTGYLGARMFAIPCARVGVSIA